MKRRCALAWLAGAAAWRPGAARAQSLAGNGVVVWGERGLWAVHPRSDAAVALTEEALAPVDVQALPRGAAAVDARGRLRTWRVEADGSWWPAWSFEPAAPVHALAASDDGAWMLAAHGTALSLLDAAGRVQRHYAGEDAGRTRQGRAAAIRHHAGRRSFVVAWPTLGEWWEIQLDPAAPPVFEGLVHDYRMGEAIATPGHFAVRRVPLGASVPSLDFCDARVPWVAGIVGHEVAIVHLDVRRRVAGWAFAEARLSGAALVRAGSGWHWWLPAGDGIEVIDTSRWRAVGRHALPAPVRAVHAAPQGPCAWLDHPRPLHAWRQGIWSPLAELPGEPSAIVSDAEGWWCATGPPPSVLRLDAAGRVARRWQLPAGAALRGLRPLAD